MKSPTLLGVAGAVFIVTAYALVSSADYQDEKAQAERYQEMVCSGRWPDYDNRNPNCED